MMKYLITAFFCTALFLTAVAQRPTRPQVKVTGKVVEIDNGQPLEFVTIALFSPKQNRIVTGGMTNQNGHFEILAPAGLYTIRIEAISYEKYKIENKKIGKDENLGTLSLQSTAAKLGEVEVIGERTTVETRLDKKIYNVGKDLTVSGGTVSDVLDNVPSITVDAEGNVALRGNNDVRILINGKPSGMVGLSSTEALRQLPAESIEKVEVITSPSARYDAEGTAGIINIILRKNRKKGLNAAITNYVGYPFSYGIFGNINYRVGKFNFFTNLGYNSRQVPGNGLRNNEYYRTKTALSEKRNIDRIRKSINTQFGIEWNITQNTQLNASVFYRDSDNEHTTNNQIQNTDANRQVSELLRLTSEKEDDNVLQYSFNFSQTFGGNSDHKLTFDAQSENTQEKELALITENQRNKERVTTVEKQGRHLLQADYILPIGEESQFEAGYRGNFNTLDTDYLVEFYNNGTFNRNQDLSNRLVYKEKIQAVYVQFGSKIAGRFSYLFGLRAEDTQINIDQITTQVFQKKSYVQLFPTVNLSYEKNDVQTFTLGFNRRIRRPRSWFINPFPHRTSAVNLFQGNPDLDPQYTNTAEFSYLHDFEKWSLSSAVYYQSTTDAQTVIAQSTNQVATVNNVQVSVIKETPINLADNQRYGFEFSGRYRFSRGASASVDFNLFQAKTVGEYQNVDYGAQNLSWFVRFNGKYMLPYKISSQIRVMYRGPKEDAQNKNKGNAFMNLAFSKDFLKDKATITLNVNDLFNTRKRLTESSTETFYSDSQFQWRERTIQLAFTYRFNQNKKRGAENRGDGGGNDFE